MSTIENNIIKQYSCDQCSKTYKDNSGLWYHNNKKHHSGHPKVIQKSSSGHPKVIQKSSDGHLKEIFCKFCKKEFKYKQGKHKHEKNCKIKEQILENDKIYKQEIEKLKLDIDKLKKSKSKKIINIQNNTLNNNCNNDNRKLTICKPGNENISLLTATEQKYIKSQELNSILSLVDHLNFNERLPQHHNFYVSAINDKYVNTLDEKTNNVTKKLKNELFDEILNSHMKKLEIMSRGDKKFQTILTKLKDIIYIKNGRKEFIKQVNMLSYNKREMVISSWYKLIEDDNITIEAFTNKVEEDIKQMTASEDDEINDSSNEVIPKMLKKEIRRLTAQYDSDDSSSSE